jgi:tetratricopeptide (TPR) repeat protein
MITVLSVLGVAVARCGANPKERLDYWRSNYEELTASDDPRVERAQAIFKRLLDAAGRKPGVVPRLFIMKRDPLNVSLPIAIPDGAIIVSKGTLDICYREPVHGEDRLAFVLAHELAHQLKDDFWHMRFFQAIEASQAQKPQASGELAEMRRLVSATDEIWTKELQADEYGIVYASMAGFDTDAIVTEDHGVNFFQAWVQALAPERLSAAYASPSHPNPQQRVETVKARLRQILDQTDAFAWGLRFYQIGDYSRATRAFEHFLHFFPSREVYHNLASSHHQLALQYYRLWQPHTPAIPFKLSLTIDPTSRASRIALRGRTQQHDKPEKLFHEHLDKAIEFYQTAISLDPAYMLSYNNLGCALFIKADWYKAIATFQDALKLAPNAPEVLNNLGVTFFAADIPQQGKSHLLKARELASHYDAPLFNLGKIAYEAKRPAEAQSYWQAYLRLDPEGPWAALIQQQGGLSASQPRVRPAPVQTIERIMGISVGAFTDEIRQAWGQSQMVNDLLLEAEPFQVAHYPQGLTTLSQDEETLLIIALSTYHGTSAKGMTIGSRTQEVLAQYHTPSRVVPMSQGESWVYDTPGIAFQFRDGKVVSWLLF